MTKITSEKSLLNQFHDFFPGHHSGCDVSQAISSSEFLHAINLDLNAIRDIYKFHLVSRRRIPMTICPSWKLNVCVLHFQGIY